MSKCEYETGFHKPIKVKECGTNVIFWCEDCGEVVFPVDAPDMVALPADVVAHYETAARLLRWEVADSGPINPVEFATRALLIQEWGTCDAALLTKEERDA